AVALVGRGGDSDGAAGGRVRQASGRLAVCPGLDVYLIRVGYLYHIPDSGEHGVAADSERLAGPVERAAAAPAAEGVAAPGQLGEGELVAARDIHGDNVAKAVIDLELIVLCAVLAYVSYDVARPGRRQRVVHAVKIAVWR